MFEIGDVLKSGWEDFKKNWTTLLLALVVAAVAAGIVMVVLQLLMTVGMKIHKFAGIGLGLVGLIAFIGVEALIVTGFVGIIIKLVRGEEAKVGDLFAHKDKIVPAFLLMLVLGIATAIGYALLIIPGIIIGLMTMFAMFFLVDKNMGVMESIKASMAATEGQRMNLFIFLLAAVGLSLLGSLACGVGNLIVAPVLALACGHIYETLKAKGAAAGA